ncbi:MAG: TetR/AcrR family transcriptional regulator [Eubacteriales bacterium]|nr:TetR/AcrR family transcriptional regulator [Eubacteriales bacterium]MDY3285713.1 TetR/AcrR family transcriptional regulator [Eubacteriales bacterium]
MDRIKTDRRVRATKLSLRTALLSMLRELPLEKITVSALCQRAAVGRGTFYTHYRDCADLLGQIEGELYAQLRELLEQYRSNSPAMRETLVRIVECIGKNADLCSVLLSENGDRRFVSRVLDLACSELPSGAPVSTADSRVDKSDARVSTADSRTDPVNARYEIRFVVCGAVGVIRAWIASGLREEPARIAGLLWRLSRAESR